MAKAKRKKAVRNLRTETKNQAAYPKFSKKTKNRALPSLQTPTQKTMAKKGKAGVRSTINPYKLSKSEKRQAYRAGRRLQRKSGDVTGGEDG